MVKCKKCKIEISNGHYKIMIFYRNKIGEIAEPVDSYVLCKECYDKVKSTTD